MSLFSTWCKSIGVSIDLESKVFESHYQNESIRAYTLILKFKDLASGTIQNPASIYDQSRLITAVSYNGSLIKKQEGESKNDGQPSTCNRR